MGEVTSVDIDHIEVMTLEPGDVILIHLPKDAQLGEGTLGGLHEWRRKYGITAPIMVLNHGAQVEAVQIDELKRRAWKPSVFEQERRG